MIDLQKEYKNLETKVIDSLKVAINNSNEKSKHNDSKSISVELYNYEELVIIDDTLNFKDHNGYNYDIFSKSSLKDLIDILNLKEKSNTVVGVMSKKEFKERSDIHVYGRGERRRVVLYYDWLSDSKNNIHGYKYMVKGYGCTKKVMLDDAYNFLIKENYRELCWYDMKIAKDDSERFKVKLSM